MATGLVTTLGRPDGRIGATWVIAVEETFDDVMDKLQPLQPAFSPELNRANMTYTTSAGGRMLINPNAIHFVIENVDEDWL